MGGWVGGVGVGLTSRVCSTESSVGASLGKPEFNSPNSAGVTSAICDGFFSFLPAWLHGPADLVRLCKYDATAKKNYNKIYIY